MEINRVMLLGNLTQDPDTRYLPSGTAVAKLRVAASRRYKDNKGEQREDTLFINVDVWGRQAETCQEYLRKGSEVLVEGSLRMNTYQTKEGQNRNEILVRADRIQFGRRSGSSSQEGESTWRGSEYEGNRPRPAGSYGSPGSSPAPRSSSPAEEPAWGSDSPGGSDSFDPGPEDVPDDSGGTNNDLPF